MSDPITTWQPRETALKDGTRIVILTDCEESPTYVAWWDPEADPGFPWQTDHDGIAEWAVKAWFPIPEYTR